MLTLEEAATRLGYSTWGFRKIVARSRKRQKAGLPATIRYFQIGRGPIKFEEQWLDDFVDANSTIEVAGTARPQARTKIKPTPSRFNVT